VETRLGRYKALWERGSDLALVCDHDLVVQYAGPALAEMFGYAPQEVVGKYGMAFVQPDDVETFQRVWQVLSAPGTHERVEIRVQHRNGGWRWVEARVTNLLDDPDVTGVVLNVHDVTERRVAVDALRASEHFHRTILEMTREGIWVADVVGRTRFANARMAELLDVELDSLRAGSVWDFFDEKASGVLREKAKRRALGVREEYELPFVDAGGAPRCLLISAAPLYERDAGFDGALAVISDVTYRKQMEDALELLSLYDAMTGLPNRTLLTDRLRELSILREERGQEFAVLVVDIDNLKHINDARGLAVGDLVICEVGSLLLEAIRDGDTLARSSGDEFVVLCPGADAYTAGRIAEGLCAAVSDAGTPSADYITVSIGVADTESVPPEQLTSAAASAVAQAKSAGRDRAVVYDAALSAADHNHIQLGEELRSAIRTGAIEVWYQPVVRLKGEEIMGAEALMRWTSPAFGHVPPSTFIPMAEELGLISELGELSLRVACTDAASWPSRRGRHMYVAVNLSANHLVSPGIVETVAAVLQESGLSPEQLTLEVTESAVLSDMAVALDALTQLRAMGICIALDDFGTGYSSMTYLRQFPVNAIKIDRSFISGLGVNADDSAIVASLVSLGAAVGVHVVAEGVETNEQKERLRRLGCEFGQGFLWSPAVPAALLAQTLDAIEAGRAPTVRAGGRRWRPLPDSATVARIQALHDSGASLSTIAAALNADGRKTTTGTRWHRQSVARVIAEPG
jgi:diguanylate cyclase (GGDEF)-like protein/PAS domain S-box-containing protein